MQTEMARIIEALQHRAKTCETAAQDATEEALTGESNAREKKTRDASEWAIKAKVWLDAEAVVRGIVEPTESPK